MSTLTAPFFNELTTQAQSELDRLVFDLTTKVIAELNVGAYDLVRGHFVAVRLPCGDAFAIQCVVNTFTPKGWNVDLHLDDNDGIYRLVFRKGKEASLNSMLQTELARQQDVFGKLLEQALAPHVQALVMKRQVTVDLANVLKEPWVTLNNRIICEGITLLVKSLDADWYPHAGERITIAPKLASTGGSKESCNSCRPQ